MKKTMALMVVICCLILQPPVNAFAGIQSGGFSTGYLSYRVEYDSTFANLNTIKNYVQKWNGISSKCSLYYSTTSQSNQITVNYLKTNSTNDNIVGMTHYYYNGTGVSNTATRNGAICFVYKTSHTTPNTDSARTAAYATCVHEVGHALSLSHSENSSDVMYTSNHSVTTPNINDKSFLKSKWGY